MCGMTHDHCTVEEERSWWLQSAGAAAATGAAAAAAEVESNLFILTLEY